MNNAERGLFIIDYFTELQEEVVEIGGLIDQEEYFILEKPVCGTTACIGGWIANKEQVPITLACRVGNRRNYYTGIIALAEKLGLGDGVGVLETFVLETKLWHNNSGRHVFGGGGSAYAETCNDRSMDLRIGDICNCWILFGYELLQDSIDD